MSILKARSLLIVIGVLVFLVSSGCHFTVAMTIGSNVRTPFSVSTNERLYLNTDRPALGNGTVTRLNYCYYGESNSRTETYQTLVAIYRPMLDENNDFDYIRIVDTITLSKQTSNNPDDPVPSSDQFLLGFNCDTYQLEPSVQVLEGDVIGACIETTSDTQQLNLVSRTDEGYSMKFLSADNARCRDGVVPEVVDDGRLDDINERILHIFAEITPVMVTTTDNSSTVTSEDVTTLPANEPFLNSVTAKVGLTVGVVLSGVLLMAVIVVTIILIIIVAVRRSRSRRRKYRQKMVLCAHGNSSNSLVREFHEDQADADFVGHPQNFSCHYETMPNTLSQRTEPTIGRRSNWQLTSRNNLYANYNTPQNSCYEMQNLSTLSWNNCHYYFTLEGPNYAYDDLVEMNITEDIYADVAPFIEPAKAKVDLYAQIKSRGIQNIDQSSIQISGHLGSGQFGRVEQGVLRVENCDIHVALKTLNNSATDDGQLKFLQEVAIMAQFRHPNVILLYGIVCKSEPITMVAELVEKGDLRKYLMTLRPRPGDVPDSDLPNLLLSFSQQVALGMQYLSSKGFVHRDLAARNILVSIDNFCKIADFGMSRDLANSKYYVSNGGVIPIKWTAPEAIHYKKYSTASDVWSYGCLLYEIWSLGHKPYETLSNIQAVRFVNKGKRLAPPPGCPELIYDLMIQCWNPTKSERPNFRTIHLNLLDNGRSVLSIPQESLDTHHLAGVLGAPLTAGERMFMDLQTRYEEIAYYDNII